MSTLKKIDIIDIQHWFQVYNIMIPYLYMFLNDCHSKSNTHTRTPCMHIYPSIHVWIQIHEREMGRGD